MSIQKMRDPETTRLLMLSSNMALKSRLAFSQSISFQCCAKSGASFELRECDARLMSEGPLSRRLMKLDADELDSEVELVYVVSCQSLEYTLTLERGNSVRSVRNLEVMREKVVRFFLSFLPSQFFSRGLQYERKPGSLTVQEGVKGLFRREDVGLEHLLIQRLSASQNTR